MGNESLVDSRAILVIFTCESREHLLINTFKSFIENCDYQFDKIILAIDGKVNSQIIDEISPTLIVQQVHRNGYVKNIINALKQVDTPYFFWLEDDWQFHKKLNIGELLNSLQNNDNWVEIVLSKTGVLTAEQKIKDLSNNMYETTFGFSANPCLCNTQHIQSAFDALENAPKGNKLGEDGFENFLTRKFEAENKKCVILDPVDKSHISHEGYLESTARNWHMTNSIENKTKTHISIIAPPSLFRKLTMIGKLLLTFIKLATKQLSNNKVYEYCFRIIRTANVTLKDE
ncbi:glycosyltransferase [Pedobacter boryungensis]|uniref:Glycosyltransferase n=1 Tax=Pedobacter boryungensis TaxID=869962 RepID=A0ABX2D7Z4_9SPHI|nr:glycosyltransferase [Pedobacter boryungensis]NQX30175.1 glycosyltransferase [Pedobacter boryungensis]